jgi:hypothetical protein
MKATMYFLFILPGAFLLLLMQVGCSQERGDIRSPAAGGSIAPTNQPAANADTYDPLIGNF